MIFRTPRPSAHRWYKQLRPLAIERALANGTPPSLIEYHEAGGPVHLSFFEQVGSSRSAILNAIEHHFRNLPDYDIGPWFDIWFNRDALKTILSQSLGIDQFFGILVDPETGNLDFPLLSNECFPDRPGEAHGYFGYAFSQPPHGIHLERQRVQEIFQEIKGNIFHGDAAQEILSWSNSSLTDVSNYFDAGMEYWGAFLFSVYSEDTKKLTIISASATD